MKTEPSEFSIDDLEKCKREKWSGVRNYQARNFMRDEMQEGDIVFFYHSSTEVVGIVGLATVCSAPYPDPSAFDTKDSHFDPKSKKENPTWILVDVCFKKKFKRTLSLDEMKMDKKLEGMRLLQRGNRLSVMPVEEKHAEYILELFDR